MSPHCVFLSHTSRLARYPAKRSYVQAAIDAVNRAKFVPSDMRFFPAEGRPPVDICIDRVRECAVYIGLFGLDYGSYVYVRECPTVSYTEQEFLTAIEERKSRGLVMFIFLLDEKAAPKEMRPYQKSQKAFRRRVNNDYGLTTALFSTPDELELQVFHAMKTLPSQQQVAPVSIEPRFVDLPRFPLTKTFNGRDADIHRLNNAWNDPKTNVLTVYAWGGVGKSALLGAWTSQMERDNYRSARAVYGCSFEGTDGDRFIEEALSRFDDPDPTAGTPEQKGLRLAELVRKERTLLVLDGFEALQDQNERGRGGSIVSPALRALVRSLALKNPGLCVIASRFPVADLEDLTQSKAPVYELAHLSPETGAMVLRALHVEGSDKELQQASLEVHGHALTLNLLGSYLHACWLGEVSKRDHLRLLSVGGEPENQARQVMESYERFLTNKRPAALSVLRMVSLFHRPAQPDAIARLLIGKGIVGLTDDLVCLKPHEWNGIVTELRELRLVLDAPQAGDSRVLVLHPLVREYFAGRVRDETPEVFRQANICLYRHFRGVKPELPDSPGLMQPLYLASVHGCQAELHNEVLKTVYWPRIKRGDESFNTKRLGEFVADLSVLRHYFRSQWDQLHDGIELASKAKILYEVAFDLRALGKTQEALGPMRACLTVQVRFRDWLEAAKTAGDLSLLSITIGQLDRALKFAQYCVRHADQSGCPFERVRARSNLVNALLQVGDLHAAITVFREAEATVCDNVAAPASPSQGRRPTLQSYWFYDLLLELKDYAKVVELVHLAPAAITATGTPHLDRALADLALARAWMGQTPEGCSEVRTRLAKARDLLSRALIEVGKAGTTHHRPRVLLASAALNRRCCELETAMYNLTEAGEIAVQCGMAIHKADFLLESARLNLARGDVATARESYQFAHDIIARIGYYRRRAELAELATVLSDDS